MKSISPKPAQPPTGSVTRATQTRMRKMDNLRLIDVREAGKAVLATLIQLHRYDLSELCGCELSHTVPTSTAISITISLIRTGRRALSTLTAIMGFLCHPPSRARSVLDRRVFVVRTHRHRGIAQAAATLAFTSNP